MGTAPPSWEIGLLGSATSEVVDACQHGGPQVISRMGKREAVVLSADDWDAIRSLLKDRLAEGSLGEKMAPAPRLVRLWSVFRREAKGASECGGFPSRHLCP